MTASDVIEEPCAVPLMDTWRPYERAAAWTWQIASGDVARSFFALMEALRPLAPLRNAVFGSPPDAPFSGVAEHAWTSGTPHAQFEREVKRAVRAAGASINALELIFDLRAWFRAPMSPAVPIQGWLEGAAWFVLDFVDEQPFGSLSLHHPLFADGDLAGGPNTELHRLNQPLLRDALAAIEASLGRSPRSRGLPGVTRTGFAPVDPAGG